MSYYLRSLDLRPDIIMWPNTFNKKCATISGWQCLGDFAAVKQQLQKIRASTRIPPRKDEEGRGASRPLPPLPGQNKSVRFNIPDGLLPPSGSEGSDQGYESDQSRVSGFISKYSGSQNKME